MVLPRRVRSSPLPLVFCLMLALGCHPAEPTPARERQAAIARGAYLAHSVGRCFWCHSPQNSEDPSSPRPEMLGAGDVLDPDTPVIAPNLTPDPKTGLGAWSDREIERAIREGIGRSGERLRGDHPAEYFSILSDEDVASIVLYLRSLKPIVNPLGRSAPQTARSETVQPFSKPAASGTSGSAVDRGAYLVHIAECVGCHTPTTAAGAPERKLSFGGGRRFVETRKGYGYEISPDPASKSAADPRLAPGERIVASANITPDPSGISYYTPELFVRTIRTGKVGGVRRLSSAMPWVYFRNLTDEDLRAVFAYLRTIPPVRHTVSNTEPASLCSRCGRRHGLGDAN